MAKPHNPRLAVVTATLSPDASRECLQSWQDMASYQLATYVVWSQLGTQGQKARTEAGQRILVRRGGGVVPAFAVGVDQAFADGAEAVVCLHDDVLISHPGWDFLVQSVLDTGVKFAGFGGGTSLGNSELYRADYDPMQLARGGFVSNMRDAEAHGKRVKALVPCVVFDGFCQIGTKDWFPQAWRWLGDSGIQHHFYDGVLGCLAARMHVQPGMLIPVACHHYGGRTAVASQEYHRWAGEKTPGGDAAFWAQAHEIGYREFKDVLPFSVGSFR